MLAWCLVVLAANPESITVAVPAFRLVSIEPELGGVYVDRFATQLAGPELKVTTQHDIEQLLGFERQRQLMGCSDDGSSCLAELAGALGVQALVSGSVARTASGYVATLRLLRTTDGVTLQSASERLRDEASLLDWMDETAKAFREALIAAFFLPKPPARSMARWVPAIVGGVSLVAGGVSLVVSLAQHQALVGGSLASVDAIDRAVSLGRSTEALGYTLVGVGVVGLAVSFLWAALAVDRPGPAASLSVGKGGAVFSLAWSWP